MKIDLQIHSTFSDGSETPEELIDLAKKHGISLISITDHDTVSHQNEIERICKAAGIGYVTGVEISSKLDDVTVHVLGYKFDSKNEFLNALLRQINEYRKESITRQFNILELRELSCCFFSSVFFS